MKRFWLRPVLHRYPAVLLVLLVAATMACRPSANAGADSKTKSAPPSVLSYQLINIFPHDTQAFTQGLEFHDGKIYESTGEEGSSSLRTVELQTGSVLRKIEVPPPYFAEGMTVLNNKIYQLTWQHHLGFIYDFQSFEKIGQFTYQGEGWGLTNDGKSLILSDGTNRIRFLDADSFQVTKTIAVFDGLKPVNELNELEYVKGQIFANIWHNNRIAIINPDNGSLEGWLDLTGLLPAGQVQDQEAVLNGIAYDQTGDRLFVTGKLWPSLFEIRIKK